MGDKMKNLTVRTLSGAVLAIVVIGATLCSQWSFGALLLAIVIGGEVEIYRMAEKRGASPMKVLGVVAGVALFVVNFLIFIQSEHLATYNVDVAVVSSLLFVLLLLPTVFICELFRNSETPMQNIGSTLLGVSYVALPISLLCFTPLLLNHGEWNPLMMIAYIFIVWANDSFAYLFGVVFGKHHMCERISPKKSWEGFVGGVAGAVGMGILAGYILGGNVAVWAGLAVVLATTGVAGDFVESMFKRSAGVKDSGNILPGHGGWLDRFDALILSAPFAFVYMVIVWQYI